MGVVGGARLNLDAVGQAGIFTTMLSQLNLRQTRNCYGTNNSFLRTEELPKKSGIGSAVTSWKSDRVLPARKEIGVGRDNLRTGTYP